MNAQLIESLGHMESDGYRLNLPECILENYAEVKKCLIKAGGKYRCNGFDFNEPADLILERLLGGEAIDDAKKFQYYPTPAALADEMIRCACIRQGQKCLEPSAGQGALLTRMADIVGPSNTYAAEIMPQNRKVLNRMGWESLGADFLNETPESLGLESGQLFDRIVANPPFTKGQDVDHIRHMHSMLAPKGRLVTLSSPSWTFRKQKKYSDFKTWLTELKAGVKNVDAGAFKESGTNVRTVMILITKP